MKKYLLFVLSLLCTFSAFSQGKVYELVQEARSEQVNTSIENLFALDEANVTSFDNSVFKNNTTQTQISLSSAVLENIVANKPSFLSLVVPISNKTSFELELIPINIFADNFTVINSNNEVVDVQLGLFYQGVVKGEKNSIVSFSISDGKVTGLISTDKGNFVLGKIETSDSYILYNDKDLNEGSDFECGVAFDDVNYTEDAFSVPSATISNVGCRAAMIYVEADNQMYLDNGSNMTTTINTVNALMGQVAILYSNENITIQISQLKVWDTVDPYVGTTTTGAMLTSFSNNVGTTFNGDVGHLLSGRNLGGGIAGLDVLCSKGTGISAGISNVLVNVPTYSNDVLVVTHELGHNFGSPHTQSCSWPGGPLDNCVAVEDGPCPPGPAPVNGGTIMSYCHITPAGTNFNNGFGLVPGNLIRLRTEQCLGSSVIPTNLVTVLPYGTSVLLGWDHLAGDTFTVQYKLTTSGTWITLPTTPNKYIQITGLTQNKNYNWRVKTSCSTYATSTFSTNSTPTISYCNPTFTNGCSFSIGIDNFSVNNVSWNGNSGCSQGGLSFLYNPIRSLTPGSTYSFIVNPISTLNAYQVGIWIDYNKNGVFAANEQVFATTAETNNASVTGTFTIPAAQPILQNTRMRVILDFFSPTNNPCGTYSYGESEDYLINIGANPCPSLLTLTSPANNIISGIVKNEASGSIAATNKITGGNVKYDAGSNIKLNPGFSVNNGAVFNAYIDGCGGQ
ncbi:Reprolysin family propeptide [Spirosomataceae bacterium TFI 002]|nr:Reprolysin family propeptide [Spirosomataceae bacterium TFI 002]